MNVTKETVKAILSSALEAKEVDMHWASIWCESDEQDEFAYQRSNEYAAKVSAYLDCYFLITGHKVVATMQSIREELDLIS